jgi:sigma-E factor negative regulatory protein RseB
MRHGMLITAVATVTVPGLLAMLAVGHEHAAAEAGVTAALDRTSPSGPSAVAPTTAGTAVRGKSVLVRGPSGVPVTVLSRVTVSQQAMGMHLLDGAADADLSTTYQGTEMVSQSGVNGRVKTISQVWHQGGGPTLVETSSGTKPADTQAAVSDAASSDWASGSPEGVFGVTKSLVALLGRNYVAADRGDGAVAHRAATVVELYRFDGSLAARYWLDRRTMVPLRRELFDSSDNVISDDSFIQVRFGAPAVLKFVGAVRAQPQAAAQPVSRPAWVAADPPARFLASLAGQGWQVPGRLLGDLPLYAAAWTKTASGEVVDLEYSDGLYVISLFVQRGTLASHMPSWRRVKMGGEQAFVSGRSVSWAGPGFVYTMIADAPPQTVTQVVGALPRNDSPGLLNRLGRGFIRLAGVINLF